MDLDGPYGDIEPIADDLVRQALAQQREHLHLARAQAGMARVPMVVRHALFPCNHAFLPDEWRQSSCDGDHSERAAGRGATASDTPGLRSIHSGGA
jgi:hypothetical protein